MNTIRINISRESEESVRLIDLWQTPISALRVFWNGDNQEYEEFFEKYHLTWEETNSIYETKQQAADILERLAQIFKQDIAQFDFRLATALKGRGLTSMQEVEIATLRFDMQECDSECQEILQDIFFHCTTRSFLDFRRIQGFELILNYSRRGYFDEGERIGIYTARNAYNLKDGIKNSRDINFILSGLCLEIAQKLPHCQFLYTYVTGVGASIDNIVAAADIVQAKQNRLAIKEKAKEELRAQKAKTRDSLAVESLEQKLMQASTTQFRMQLEDSFDEYFEKGFEYYNAKELEKFHMRLQKAKENAKEAYTYIRTQIDEGLSLKESLDLVKQKYRDEDTLNLASMLIARDILEISKKETQIANLKEELTLKEKEYKKLYEQIAKMEQTISSLRGSLSEKVNEFNLYKEKAKEELEDFAQKAKQAVQEELQQLIQEKEELEIESSENATLIDRLNVENQLLKENLNKLEQHIKELQIENRDLYAFKINHQDSM
ncbi:hypothetical protein CCZ01_06840 [Helicobacter monodelphidis]|nr:hypothetical protein CCZ01_06840 [Helicobacter sp. 15-1451]